MTVFRVFCPLPALTLVLLFGSVAQAAPPTLGTDPAACLRDVQSAASPEARTLRQEIADGPAALARERAEAQREGLAVFPSQLNRPMPPEDRNAAPLYQKLDDLRHARPLGLPGYSQSLSARFACSPAHLDAVQQVLDARQDVFTLLHQAVDRPECVFPHDWTLDWRSFPPHEAGLRESSREVKTESVLLAERGRYAEAVMAQTRGYRVAEHAASDPTLVSYFVGSAIETIATSGIGDILTLAGPNADVAEEVRQAVSERAAHLSLRHGLSGEVAIQEAEFATLRSADADDVRLLFSSDAPDPRLPRTRFTPEERQTYLHLVDAAEADGISRMRRVLAAIGTPGEAAALAQAGQDATESSDPIREIANKLSPFQPGALSAVPDRAAAYREVTLAAAAVLAERAKAGAYPGGLPSGFPDPWNGRPLGYRREGADGFVVYSVGPTGRFDGGKPGQTLGGETLFRYPAVPLPPAH